MSKGFEKLTQLIKKRDDDELPTDEQREKAWKTVVEQVTTEIAYLENHGGSSELLKCLSNEIFQGACPSCGKAWKRIEIDNTFIKGYFYEPSCRCYHYCIACKRHLWHEQLTGKMKNIAGTVRCPNCNFKIMIDGEPNTYLHTFKKKKKKSKQEKIIEDIFT